MEIITLTDTASTNDYLLDRVRRQPQWEGAVTTPYQSAGKGMGTNRWESESGKNLLYSILIHPTWLPARKQYLLSMAQAVAVCDVLNGIVSGFTVKWPNDIYWRDRKLSGTRIDVNISARGLQDMVIGTGINVNQREFRSDAPNPVSLWQITGEEHSVPRLLEVVVCRFEYYCGVLRSGGEDRIMRLYHAALYRGDGKLYLYEDAAGRFMASIKRVDPDGTLHLLREDGTESVYQFKEVKTLLDTYY